MISVIIPNYNTSQYLKEAISSVYNSNIKEYEIIVVDDGSTDDYLSVIKDFEHLQNFKFIRQNNAGLAAARNTGIKSAAGQYLVFLDSDDLIEEDKLQIQSNMLDENPNVDVVYSRSIFFIEDDPSKRISTLFPCPSGIILEKLLAGNFIHVNSAMVRSSAIEKVNNFDSDLRALEEWDLWLRMATEGSIFIFYDKILSSVRIRKKSMTSNKTLMYQTMVHVLEKTIKNIQDKSSLLDQKKYLIRACESFFIYKLLAKDFSRYLRMLSKYCFQIGVFFWPVAFKLAVKYTLHPVVKHRTDTLAEIDKYWADEN